MQKIFEGEKTIYQQIAKTIEDDILKDILKTDDVVPSTNQLAKFYTINPATAAKGLNTLVEEGILYKKRGLGMYISEGAREKVIQKRKLSFYHDLLINVLKEAEFLDITKKELADMILKSDISQDIKGE